MNINNEHQINQNVNTTMTLIHRSNMYYVKLINNIISASEKKTTEMSTL